MTERISWANMGDGILLHCHRDGDIPELIPSPFWVTGEIRQLIGRQEKLTPTLSFTADFELLLSTEEGTSVNLRKGSTLVVGKGFWYVLHPKRCVAPQEVHLQQQT